MDKPWKILAADIGGTSSRFASFTSLGQGKIRHEASQWLPTEEASSLEGLLQGLGETSFPLAPEEADMAVIAVAGPVEDGRRSTPPNISWDIDLDRIGSALLPGRVLLVNDFFAQAFATVSPIAAAAERILEGEAAGEGAIAVIGAGTGLGHAALVPDGRGAYLAVPSEKGHAAFPLVMPGEEEYLAFHASRTGDPYPRGDTILSGRGMALLHAFLTGEELTPEEITPKLGEEPDTVAWFSRFYGRACRDYALAVLGRGGVYIAGGLAARTPELVRHPAFAEEFRSSPTMGELLEKIPVFLIHDQESGLWGAARFGLQELTVDAEHGR
jgi:glucokinase